MRNPAIIETRFYQISVTGYSHFQTLPAYYHVHGYPHGDTPLINALIILIEFVSYLGERGVLCVGND